jgi:beta-1,4-mannosyl-glycoprotein beta-1,4-N-acetylglucosaminyltransferase
MDGKKAMIYSTTMFYGNPDLIDLKISEERDHVDRFLIIESKVTHSGMFKGLSFPKEKYREDPKVVYMVIEEDVHMKCRTAWDRERFQRDYPRSQIDIKDEDIFIVADMDEIIQKEEMQRLIGLTRELEFVGMEMPLYYYFINVYRGRWRGPFMATGRMCRKYDFNELYNRAAGKPGHEYVLPVPMTVPIRGRHFSYLTDVEGIALKIRSAAHTEYNREKFTDIGKIKKRVNGLSDLFDRGEGKYQVVEVDQTYPKTILNNLRYWEKYIRQAEACST